MKAFIVSIIAVTILGIAGFQYMSHQTPAAETAQSQDNTLTGLVQTGKGDDYSFVLVTKEKVVGITSQKIKLDTYVNKNVAVTGQYSGTTLYVDIITEK